MIVDNSRIIGAIFRCAAVAARNTIIILVIIVGTIFLAIIRYDIGSAVVILIVIGRMMAEIMVMEMTIVVGYYCSCCLEFLSIQHRHNCCCTYCRVSWVHHFIHRWSISGQDLICCI